jgi:hypothetical protein
MTTYLNFQYTNIFDNSAAKADLDFKVTVDWKSGAKRTYDWLVENDRIENWQGYPFYDQIIESYKQQTGELIAELADYHKRQ